MTTTAPRTPAGAWLRVTRDRRWTRIEVDRWPITDATAEQADVAHDLAVAAARRCFTVGRRAAISYGCGRTVWSVTVPAADTDATLDALLVLEAGDPEPARTLTAALAAS